MKTLETAHPEFRGRYASYFPFDITPSPSPRTEKETEPRQRLNWRRKPCIIRYPHLLSPKLLDAGGKPAENSHRISRGIKRKRGEPVDVPLPQPKQYVLVALLTDSQPMVSEFEKFHASFETRGIEAVYISLIDLETCGREATSDSVPLFNQSPKTSVQNYYTATKNPADMKKKVLQWVSTNTVMSKEGDTVVFIPIGHGVGTGSMLIGERKTRQTKAYLTTPEIKEAISRIGAGVSFTLVNTAWYHGGWIPIRDPGEDAVRFIRCRSEKEPVSSLTVKCFEGGTSALLSTLRQANKTDGDYLEEFIVEVRDTETEPNPFSTSAPVDQKTIAEDDEWYHAVFWRTTPTAFVPFDPSHVFVQDSILAILHSLHHREFGKLYYRLAKSRVPDVVPHALIPEVIRVQSEVGANRNESALFEACRTVIDSPYRPTPWQLEHYPSLVKPTVIWHEERWLQARAMVLSLAESGWLDTNRIACTVDRCIDSKMTNRGWKLFDAASPLRGIVVEWREPKKHGAIGFEYDGPTIWICNILSELTKVRVSKVRKLLALMVEDVTQSV
jgi:hypothetical protein